jgi:hypothetical protein
LGAYPSYGQHVFVARRIRAPAIPTFVKSTEAWRLRVDDAENFAAVGCEIGGFRSFAVRSGRSGPP